VVPNVNVIPDLGLGNLFTGAAAASALTALPPPQLPPPPPPINMNPLGLPPPPDFVPGIPFV
jgi:hypothetical protein